ncbi:uncharacterized protein LOC113324181 [Papaver somniferum]|uniref:uncharacterized protein LOC113324181 n=1 Tax=Papaver somniferum TaxID=3469 RepID=UPI000E6FE9A7|nr:uncharacterized protein LOC113324181 [Papaver somniferum]
MKTPTEEIWVRDSNKPQGRRLWNNIQKQKEVAEKISRVQINKGDAISFWNDVWEGTQSLKHRFPLIHKLALHKNDSVRAMISTNAWDIKLKRNPNSAEPPEILEMFKVLGMPPQIKEEEEEELIGTEPGGFSSKTCYKWLEQQLPTKSEDPHFSCICIQKVPPKIQFFMWTAAQNLITTTVNLIRRGCQLQNIMCSLCNAHPETVDHLLLHCSYSHKVWSYFIRGLNIKLVQAGNLNLQLHAWKFRKGGNRGRKLWPPMIFAVCWALWNERNSRVMTRQRYKEEPETILEIKHLTYVWGGKEILFKFITFRELVTHWKVVMDNRLSNV